MSRQPFLLPALLLLTALRLAALPLRELSPIESYAVVCGDHHGLWHAMLGPVLPALVHITTAIFSMNEFGVRVLAPLIIFGASWMLWLVARGLFDVQTAAWSVVLFNVLPVVNLAAVTLTPMTLSIALSAATLLMLRRALHKTNRWHLPWWIVSAVLCLGFLTDWHLVMLAVAAALALAVTTRGRRALLKWPVLPVTGGALGIMIAVFLWWMSQHQWLAFHAFAGSPPIAGMLWRFMLVLPLPALASLVWALVQSVTRKPLIYPVVFLFAFGLPLMMLDLLSFGSLPWPQFGYGAWITPLVILLAHQLSQWQPMNLAIKPLARSLVLLITSAQSCILIQTDIIRSVGIAWKFSSANEERASWLPADPSSDLMGWSDLAKALRAIMKDEEAKLRTAPLIVADRWQLAASLSVYLKDAPLLHPTPEHPRVLLLPESDKLTPYAHRPGLTESLMANAPVLFVTDHIESSTPPAFISKQYHTLRLVGFFKVKHGELALRTVKVFACSP